MSEGFCRAYVERKFFPRMVGGPLPDSIYENSYQGFGAVALAQSIGSLVGTVGSGVVGGVLTAQQAKEQRAHELDMAKATAAADAAHANAAAASAEAFSDAVPWVAGAIMLAGAAFIYFRHTRGS